MSVYKSEVLTMAVGGDTKVLPLSFLPAVGTRRGRNVINRIILKISVQVDTDGATTIQTAGWSRFLTKCRIWDAQGDLVSLSGPEIRALHILNVGRDHLVDPTDVAISQSNTTRDIYLCLDFAPKYRTRRRWDYALPADTLHSGGGIEFATAAASAIGTGGGVTVDSCTITAFFHCREEHDLQAHSRRELRSVTAQNTDDVYLPVNGGYIRSAFLFKQADHDTGGTTQDATAVTIEGLGIHRIAPSILQRLMQQEGNSDPASTQDPFVQSTAKAVPLVWPSADGKITDMPTHPGQMLVRLESSTVSNNVIVYELVTRRTELSTTAEQAIAGGPVVASVKTLKGTKKDPNAWGRLQRVMPGKLRRAG